MSRIASAAASVAALLLLFQPAPILAQTVRFEFDNRPRMTIGDTLRVDFRTKIQSDLHDPSTERKKDETAFELAKRRIGVDIELYNRLAFEVDVEIANDRPWKNVFADLRIGRPLQIQAGRFKMPFSAEQLTTIVDVPFIDRSLAASTIAPARDTGVMLHGRVGGRWLGYEAGLFRHDGDAARRGDLEGAGQTAAARLTSNLGVKGLSIGAAATHGRVPEGLNGLPGRTSAGFDFFEPVYVKGRRVRVGAEANWRQDRYQLDAEWMQLRDQRLGQGLGDVDLSDVVADGWYVSGTWMLRHAPRPKGGKKRFFDRGAGDIELAARFEGLGFGSTRHVDIALPHPRADNLLRSEVRVATFGVNWYVNRWAKVLGNVYREQFSDWLRHPSATQNHDWRWAIRLQWAM